jgi:hypothetical protein
MQIPAIGNILKEKTSLISYPLAHFPFLISSLARRTGFVNFNPYYPLLFSIASQYLFLTKTLHS